MTLERLKELANTFPWNDEDMLDVEEIFPRLIEVAEAAWEYRYLCDALHAAKVNSKDEWEAHKKALEAEARLDAALAKLEGEV